jgi:hypothetical protein
VTMTVVFPGPPRPEAFSFLAGGMKHLTMVPSRRATEIRVALKNSNFLIWFRELTAVDK